MLQEVKKGIPTLQLYIYDFKVGCMTGTKCFDENRLMADFFSYIFCRKNTMQTTKKTSTVTWCILRSELLAHLEIVAMATKTAGKTKRKIVVNHQSNKRDRNKRDKIDKRK